MATISSRSWLPRPRGSVGRRRLHPIHLLFSAITCLTLAVALVLSSAELQPRRPTNWLVNKGDTYKIAQLNGPGSINQTDTRWDVYGADLGHMFMYENRLYMVFGDTFGGSRVANPFLSVPRPDWRSNVLAIADTTSRPVNGLWLTDMITDRPGHAAELLGSIKLYGTEETVIPSYGASVGSRMFLYYMSINRFTSPGNWYANYSGVAFSDDGGHTWTKDPAVTWPADSGFSQVALVDAGPYFYVYGTTAGRYGSLRLARVPRKQLLDLSAYQYWNGSSWTAGDFRAAVDILPAPIGELSVQWNSYYRKWIMMHLLASSGQIVLRTSDSPVGPWTTPKPVVGLAQFPEANAPYITPIWNDRSDIYFTMSVYGPYQVYLMHTSLAGG